MPLPIKNYPRSKLLSGLPTSLHLYTVAEVAIILGTNAKMVNEWIKDGLLPAFALGKEKHFLRVRALDLENFIDAQVRTGKINLTKK